MDDENQLINVAMEIIINAGNARTKASQALDLAMENDFEAAQQLMLEAKEDIKKAHNAQTDTIQDETRGKKHEVLLLFVHAQDTIMTIISEYNMTEQMIKMYKKIYTEMRK
jgi:cellobiose PTS system EIIA component